MAEVFGDRLWDIRDRRVDEWPLMNSPWPTFTLCAAYVYFVKFAGPAMMKERPPMELKKTIQVYNVIQVVLSAYIFIEAMLGGWGTYYNWKCQPVDRSPRGERMANICWVYYISKFTEFFDTFFFVVRKKFNQVSLLHVFHHGVMPIYSWTLTRWLPGGHESFGGTFNSLIHVIMYSYYFLATLGPAFQKYLWWKKYLTAFQMFQFASVLVKNAFVIFGPNCGYPWQFSVITAALMTSFFCLFANFYVNSYSAKKTKRVE